MNMRILIAATSALALTSAACKARRNSSNVTDKVLRNATENLTYVVYSEGDWAYLTPCDMKETDVALNEISRETCPAIKDDVIRLPLSKYREALEYLKEFKPYAETEQTLARKSDDLSILKEAQAVRFQKNLPEDEDKQRQIAGLQDETAKMKSFVTVMKTRKDAIDEILGDMEELGLPEGSRPIYKGDSLFSLIIDGFSGQKSDGVLRKEEERALADEKRRATQAAAAKAAYEAWAGTAEWQLAQADTFGAVSTLCAGHGGRIADDFEIKALRANEPDKFASLGINIEEPIWTPESKMVDAERQFSGGKRSDLLKAAARWFGDESYAKTIRLKDGISQIQKVCIDNTRPPKFAAVCISGKNISPPTGHADMNAYLKSQENKVGFSSGSAKGIISNGEDILLNISKVVAFSDNGRVPRSKEKRCLCV